jgi:outer membrane lipoprotein-sorting protein
MFKVVTKFPKRMRNIIEAIGKAIFISDKHASLIILKGLVKWIRKRN